MRAFWILMTVMLAVVLMTAAVALGSAMPWAWGVGAVVPVLPGLFSRRWFELGVSAWNKAVALTTSLLRAYTLRVCYYVFFGPVSRAGSSLGLDFGRTERSRWIPRGRRESEFEKRASLEQRDGWRRELVAFAGRPEKGWMVCLFPVVWLLHLLRDKPQESVPISSTYTLY